MDTMLYGTLSFWLCFLMEERERERENDKVGRIVTEPKQYVFQFLYRITKQPYNE